MRERVAGWRAKTKINNTNPQSMYCTFSKLRSQNVQFQHTTA